jgi:hypothetical protein
MLEHGPQPGSSASPYPSPRTLEPRGDAVHRPTFAQVKQRPPETQWNFETGSLSSGKGVPHDDGQPERWSRRSMVSEPLTSSTCRKPTRS